MKKGKKVTGDLPHRSPELVIYEWELQGMRQASCFCAVFSGDVYPNL